MPGAVSKEQLENQLDVMVHQHKEMVAQIEQLKQQQQITVANANAAEGAIQVLQYLLSQCDDSNNLTEMHASITEQEKSNGDGKTEEHPIKQEAGHDNDKPGRNTKAPEIVETQAAKSKSGGD